MNDKTLISDIAALLCEVHHFARDRAGRLLFYKGGVYVPGAEFFLRQEVKRLLLLFDKIERWSTGLSRELIEYILLDAPDIDPRPSDDLINLDNGLLNIWTGQLLPHSPRMLSSIRIPVQYDPTAKCDRVEEFVLQVFPADSSMLAWEILGDLLTPDRSIQKAIALVGEGGNGKGVFLQLAVNLMGVENVSHLTLQKLEADRFASARLYGKLANICSDLPSERLTGSAVFKAITGCDRLTGEFKYQDSFEFTPFARLLISANHLPIAMDASKAFFDRWLIIPFESTFRSTRQEIPRRVLDAALSSPQELSGTLNQILPALRRLRREGKFSETTTMRRELHEFKRATDPLAQWLAGETTSKAADSIPQERLYRTYSLACMNLNRPIMTKQMFGRRLRSLRPDIQETQRTVEGKRQWIYCGIALRSQPECSPILEESPVRIEL